MKKEPDFFQQFLVTKPAAMDTDRLTEHKETCFFYCEVGQGIAKVAQVVEILKICLDAVL